MTASDDPAAGALENPVEGSIEGRGALHTVRRARPLDGLLVVSVEQAVAAPYCTRLLADHGARVIKVERPDGGDFARSYDTRVRGEASYFVWANRSKESLTLDLKTPHGLSALTHLIARADVFVQNLAPGAADRLGLGAQALGARYPRLITCSISGYGETGPYADRKAYDLLIQAEAGLLSLTGTPDAPAKCGLSIADIAAGVSAYNAILLALINRQRTGRGDHIDIAMLEAMTEWSGHALYFAYDGAEPPPRSGAAHATLCPYGPFATRDGEVLFGLQNDREWAAFCRDVLDRPDMAEDDRFLGNDRRAAEREAIDEAITAALRAISTAEALTRLDRAGIGTAEVRDMAAVWAHPQLQARARWTEIETPGGMVSALRPVTGAGWDPAMGPVPALGAQTEAILEEFDLSFPPPHPTTQAETLRWQNVSSNGAGS